MKTILRRTQDIGRCLAILALLALPACSDFLTEEPKSSLTSENLGTSREGMEAVVLGIQEYTYQLSPADDRANILVMDAPSDDIVVMSSTLNRQEMDLYTWGPDNANIERKWNVSYQAMSRINTAVDLIQNSTYPDQNVKNSLEAEARFFRAFFYFDLVRLFGPVPLLTEPYDPAQGIPTYTRASEADVYAQIKQDVQFAIANLPEDRSGMAGGRPTKDAARMLGAQVHVTLQEWSQAAALTREIKNGGRHTLHPNYLELFQPAGEDHSESILKVVCMIASNSNRMNEMGINIIDQLNPFGQRGYRGFRVTDELYSLYEAGDKRLNSLYKGEYINQATGAKTSTYRNYPFSLKYSDPSVPPAIDLRVQNTADYHLMRYAETLLTLAEAINESGSPTAEAYDAINQVRARAGLPALSGLNQSQFRDAVRLERRKELYHENVRWFDLKRWGRLKDVESAIAGSAGTLKPVVQLPKHERLPIPNSEIVTTGLEQNPGY